MALNRITRILNYTKWVTSTKATSKQPESQKKFRINWELNLQNRIIDININFVINIEINIYGKNDFVELFKN